MIRGYVYFLGLIYEQKWPAGGGDKQHVNQIQDVGDTDQVKTC